MAGKNAIATIFERNRFYRRQFHMAFFTFFMSLIVIGILSGVLYYIWNNPTFPVYFATDNVGRLIKIVPVSQPNMSDADAEQWAIEAATKAYSYDHVNYREQLQNAQKYFTTYGWTQYMDALTASNNLVALKRRRMVIVANVVGKPKLVTKGRLAGAFAWKFEMPMLVTYLTPPYDTKSRFSNALTVDIIIQRQPILQSYKGLGVLQIISKMASGPSQPAEISNQPT